MDAQSPHIVGIAGVSCAGKSWLASRLCEAFRGEAIRVSLDDFYLDRSHLAPARRARVNFDHPRAIDWDRLESTLSEFLQGKPTSIPTYDFATHRRLACEVRVQPASLVIVEGLWLLRKASIRKMLNWRIFIRSSEKLCSERRLERDTRERGRTPVEVMEQLQRFTLPMSRRFVAPQERWADVVLEAPLSQREVEDLTNRIREKLFRATGI